MDSKIIKNNRFSQISSDNYNYLNSNPINNSEVFSTKNGKINKLKNVILKILFQNKNSLNLKSAYFNKWKNIKMKNNLRSLKILKFENKIIKFDNSLESPIKNKQSKNLLAAKIILNLLRKKSKNPVEKLKFFFERWKNLKYINKSRNIKFNKTPMNKLQILHKRKNTDISSEIKDDDIYDNIILILNKYNNEQKIKEVLTTLKMLEKIEKSETFKSFNSNDSIKSNEEKSTNNFKNKISERIYKKIKNVVDKNDIKQKYFSRWKKLTIFKKKSTKPIKRIRRIIFTKKSKDFNTIDYDIKSFKSFKTMDNITNLNLINKKEENELANYILPLYQKVDKFDKSHIKDTLLKILKALEEKDEEIKSPKTPQNDSSFSFSFVDNNADKSEEDSFTNNSMRSVSKRIRKRLKNIFDDEEIKKTYFNRWKENVKLKSRKSIKRIKLNTKEKTDILKRIMTSDIFSKKEKKYSMNENINKVRTDNLFNNEQNKINKIEEKGQKNKNQIESTNDYLNIKKDSNELINNDKKEIKYSNDYEDEKNQLEKMISSAEPKKFRNSSSFAINSNFGFESPPEKKENPFRHSTTFGVYRMSFKKVVLKRSDKSIKTLIKKRAFKEIFNNIIKNKEKKSKKKYFNIWKNNDNIFNSDNSIDNENEELLEIIKTNDIKFINTSDKKNEIKLNEEKVDEIKSKNSSLNGIYGLCFTQDFTNYKNKEEYVSIDGNEKSKEINGNIQPLFSDFLKSMNCSIATFNLFTYYTQFHDNKFLLKKKFLPIWRRIK